MKRFLFIAVLLCLTLNGCMGIICPPDAIDTHCWGWKL